METVSLWRGVTAAAMNTPSLAENITADVVVVGGGITGLTVALRIAEAGQTVALLESGAIGGGDTGGSTGNLYETVSGGFDALTRKWNSEVAGAVGRSRREAVELIEQTAQRFGIDCGFRRCKMYLYAGSAAAKRAVDSEFDAACAAGVQVHMEESLPDGPPRAHGSVLILDQQAQFDPFAYVQAVARQAGASGCRIFENSPVIDIDSSRRFVRTAAGSVSASEIVLATHSPSGIHVVQTGMVPNREYGMATPIPDGSFPPGIFWMQGDDRLSVRGVETPAGNFLVCIGQEHKTGQHDARAATDALERLARERLAVQDIVFRWSAQNFRSPDLLPYIGKDGSGTYIATGFAADGLVYGTLAASIISDEILGRGTAGAISTRRLVSSQSRRRRPRRRPLRVSPRSWSRTTLHIASTSGWRRSRGVPVLSWTSTATSWQPIETPAALSS